MYNTPMSLNLYLKDSGLAVKYRRRRSSRVFAFGEWHSWSKNVNQGDLCLGRFGDLYRAENNRSQGPETIYLRRINPPDGYTHARGRSGLIRS